MKKNILFFLLYTIMCFTSYSQNKQISYSSVNGLVTYDNGSGTKADIGAKLYIIPCKYFKQDIELKNDSIQMGYESLLQYIKWKELVGQEQAIAKLKEYDFYISAEEQIRREGELAICLVDILKSNKVKYGVCLCFGSSDRFYFPLVLSGSNKQSITEANNVNRTIRHFFA